MNSAYSHVFKFLNNSNIMTSETISLNGDNIPFLNTVYPAGTHLVKDSFLRGKESAALGSRIRFP